jgi:hypothetical protein
VRTSPRRRSGQRRGRMAVRAALARSGISIPPDAGADPRRDCALERSAGSATGRRRPARSTAEAAGAGANCGPGSRRSIVAASASHRLDCRCCRAGAIARMLHHEMRAKTTIAPPAVHEVEGARTDGRRGRGARRATRRRSAQPGQPANLMCGPVCSQGPQRPAADCAEELLTRRVAGRPGRVPGAREHHDTGGAVRKRLTASTSASNTSGRTRLWSTWPTATVLARTTRRRQEGQARVFAGGRAPGIRTCHRRFCRCASSAGRRLRLRSDGAEYTIRPKEPIEEQDGLSGCRTRSFCRRPGPPRPQVEMLGAGWGGAGKT